MSDKPLPPVSIVTPEEYGRNLAQIQAAKAYIAEMERTNEAGRESYESELLRKIREGQEALQRLQDLERLRNSGFNGPLAIEAGPSSARIEEVSSQNAQWAAAQVPAQPSLQTPYQRHTASTSTQPAPTARTPYNHYPYGADRQQYPVEQQFNQSYMGQTMNGGYAQQMQRAPPPYNYVYQSQPTISTYGDPPFHSVSQSGRSQQTRPPPPPPVAVPNSTTQTTNRGYSSRVDNKSRPTARTAPSQPRGASGNQTSALSQPQTAASSTRGVASVSRQQSNGETVQKVPEAMHYTPTNAQQSAASTLTNALGQPSSTTHYRVNASSSPSVTNITNPPKRPDPQPPVAVAGPLTDKPQAPVSPVNHRDLITDRILKFREAILDWGNLALPGASRKYDAIQAYKDSNKTLRIISMVDGRRVDEDFDVFFKRLWMKAGLLPGALTPKPVPMAQQSSLSKTTLPPAPVPMGATPKTTSDVASRPSEVAQNTAVPNTAIPSTSSSSLAAAPKSVSHPSLHAPSTPSRRKTLVDVGGTWRSPADADKKKLARDVMFALGKRKDGAVSPSGSIKNASKRPALEISSVSGSSAVSAPVLQPSTGVLSTTSSAGLSQQPNNQRTSTPVTSTQSMPGEVTQSIPLQVVEVSMQVQEHDQSSASTRPSNADAVLASETTTAILTAPQPIDVPGQSIGQALSPVPPASSPIAPGAIPIAVQPSPAPSLPQLHTESSSTAITESRPVRFINTFSSGVSPGSSVVPVGFLPPWSQAQASVTSPTFLQGPLTSSNNLTKNSQPPVLTSSVPTTQEVSASKVTADNVDISTDANARPSGLNPWSTGDMVSLDEVVPSSPKPAEPLFLPSPSSSPGPLTDGTSVAYDKRRSIYPLSSIAKSQGKGRDKRSSVYVLVPPPPEYLVHLRKREAKKVGRLSRNGSTRNSSVVSGSVATSTSSEDLSFAFETERDSTIDPLEKQAVQLACSRLQALPCRWDRCDIVLNSKHSLLRHLNEDHKPIPKQGGNTRQSFICRWTQCGRQCSIRENHFERHALVPFQCAFEGCKETHRSSRQLRKHFETAHVNGKMRPQATPFYPKDLPLVPLPDIILPSYLIVAPPAQPFPISKDRHATFVPWVWRNIARSDDEPKANNNPMLSNNYGYLNNRATRYSWIQSQPVNMDFADLESEEISKQCDEGLTFFAEDGESIAGASEGTQERTERSSSPLFLSAMDEDADTNLTEEHNHFVRLPVLQLSTNDDEDSIQRLLWGDEE